MALCYTRLLCRRSLEFQKYRGLYTSRYYAGTNASTSTVSGVCETHDEKNARLKRPMSPHLTIYQVQLTSTLSITHRATGMILSAYMGSLGIGCLIAGGFPCLLELFESCTQCMSSGTVFAAKFAFALPVTYHIFNGLRHLVWDWTAKCLSTKGVYQTGYLVVALTVLSAIGLAAS